DHETPIAELRRLLNVQLAMFALGESRRLMTDKKIDEALAAAQRAVDLWPDASDPYLYLGILAYTAGDKERALTAMKKGAKRNPLFRGQLEGTLKFMNHPGLDPEFLKGLFPE
ncbi:MAG: tetratricopeptide repeat protein, partial [Vicinamibacteria bacterium]